MIGDRLGDYEIVGKIGQGGMGEVYRARDHQLHRDVAIKVLSSERMDSPEARQRFEREAQAVAALSHPNILAIHGFGEHEGHPYAVTELLEGRSLAEQLTDSPLPLRRALDLAAQAAEGLAAAHERGIVHRDIKPGNLFLLPDGRLVILDFGLAKARAPHDPDTRTALAADETSPGAIMGTVRYMSPEQVRGAPVDGRSDIFALGIVLWEMVAGEVAFDRDTAVETMNAILNEDLPGLAGRVQGLPPGVARIVERCVEKEPGQRFQSARDLAFALRSTHDGGSQSFGPGELTGVAPTRGRWRWTAPAGLLALGLLAGLLVARLVPDPPAREPILVRPLTHSGHDFAPSASPDGNTIAFVSDRDGTSRIWLRQMKGGAERPLTDGPDGEPRFSPDGSSVLFMHGVGREITVQRVPVLGGPARTVLPSVVEAAWGPDGRRLAYLDVEGTIEQPVARLKVHELDGGGDRTLASFPRNLPYGIRWSPDGRWISAATSSYVQNNRDNWLVLVDAGSGEMRQLRRFDVRISPPAWGPGSSSLVFARSTSLLGDISSPVGLVHEYQLDDGSMRPLFWVQSVWGGASDFVRFDRLGEHDLVFDEILWHAGLVEYALDDAGRPGAPRVLTRGNARDRQPAISPDGRTVVFSSNRAGNLDIWILELATGELRQLTDDGADDWDPGFSADGRHILWSSNRSGPLEIWMARVDGSGARQLTQDGEDAENPTQTPDGEWVLYGSGNTARGGGIWILRTDGSEERQVAAGATFLPELSPDGRFASFFAHRPDQLSGELRVVEVATGELVMAEPIPYAAFQSTIAPGRSRWMPDGQSIVFNIPREGTSHFVLIEQDFRPGEDTSASRRVLLELEDAANIESFGIGPDGRSIIVSRLERFRTLKLAEDVFGER